MLSKLTMIGLNRYSEGALWEQLVLPDGMDKELFINECLRQGGEFPVLYADLDFMKLQIGEWSKKWLHNFERWWKAYQFEYEALFNLDVKSTRTEIGTNTANSSATGNDNSDSNVTTVATSTANSSATGNVTSNGSNTDTSDLSKAAYDSSNMVPVEHTSNGGNSSVITDNTNSSNSNNSTTTNTSNSTINSNSLTRNDTSNHEITTEEIRQGNQGVTMSQEMLLAEYNAWSFNIYSHMAEIFVSEMCICIYL